MGYGDLPYQIVYLVHLGCIVVGFGSSFVYPVLAARSRSLSPREAYAVNHTALEVSPYLTSYPILGAGGTGILLVLLGRDVLSFADTWLAVALVVFALGVLVAVFLLAPNLAALDALEAELLDAPPAATGSESPPAVAEVEERRQKASTYSGLIHVFWLLLMIDMIWKPGLTS